jgi:dihydrodipicolinate synthase/N-acetylneuraminate lyase
MSGCIVPMVTPVLKNGEKYEVDGTSLEKMVSRITEAKVFGIFILGNAGGFQFLSLEMKKKVIEAVAGKTKFFVGVSDKNVSNSVILTKYAEEKGAAGAVVLPCYRDGWERILENTQIPMIFYNNPHICESQGLDVDMVKKFRTEYPGRLAAIKESSGDRDLFKKFAWLQTEMGIPVFQGDATSLVWAKSLESKIEGYKLAGAVPVHANAEAENYVGFLENPGKYTETINSYVKTFPSIRATIEELVKRNLVMPDTLDFWDENHK